MLNPQFKVASGSDLRGDGYWEGQYATLRDKLLELEGERGCVGCSAGQDLVCVPKWTWDTKVAERNAQILTGGELYCEACADLKELDLGLINDQAAAKLVLERLQKVNGWDLATAKLALRAAWEQANALNLITWDAPVLQVNKVLEEMIAAKMPAVAEMEVGGAGLVEGEVELDATGEVKGRAEGRAEGSAEGRVDMEAEEWAEPGWMESGWEEAGDFDSLGGGMEVEIAPTAPPTSGFQRPVRDAHKRQRVAAGLGSEEWEKGVEYKTRVSGRRFASPTEALAHAQECNARLPELINKYRHVKPIRPHGVAFGSLRHLRGEKVEIDSRQLKGGGVRMRISSETWVIGASAVDDLVLYIFDREMPADAYRLGGKSRHVQEKGIDSWEELVRRVEKAVDYLTVAPEAAPDGVVEKFRHRLGRRQREEMGAGEMGAEI